MQTSVEEILLPIPDDLQQIRWQTWSLSGNGRHRNLWLGNITISDLHDGPHVNWPEGVGVTNYVIAHIFIVSSSCEDMHCFTEHRLLVGFSIVFVLRVILEALWSVGRCTDSQRTLPRCVIPLDSQRSTPECPSSCPGLKKFLTAMMLSTAHKYELSCWPQGQSVCLIRNQPLWYIIHFLIWWIISHLSVCWQYKVVVFILWFPFFSYHTLPIKPVKYNIFTQTKI